MLFGLISSGLTVPRTLGLGEVLKPSLGLPKRGLPCWAKNWLVKLGQPPRFKSFGGFAGHQRLSAIPRGSCYSISDRTFEKISHLGADLSSDESDKRRPTSWFIPHRFANGILSESLRSVRYDRWWYRPLDLVHFRLDIPWGFCSTQRRLQSLLRKYIACPGRFNQPELDHTCQRPLAYGAWSTLAVLLSAILCDILQRINSTSQYRLHFAIGLLLFQIIVLTRSRFELQLRAFPRLCSWQLELLLRCSFHIGVRSSLRCLSAARHWIALSGTSCDTSIGLVFIISVEIRQVIKGPIFLH